MAPGTINYYFIYFIYFIESLAIIGTNGFVLLTGYFSWKKTKVSLRKPFGLILYVVAYNVLFYILNIVLLQTPFSLKSFVFSFVPRNWYITLYIVLSLLSPYINVLIEKLNKESYLAMLKIMLVSFSIWPTLLDIVNIKLGIDTTGMNTVAINGASSGYSLINFTMLYLIGAGISKFDMLRHKFHWDVIAYFICSILIFVQQITVGAGWSYANPFVIFSCISFFNIFRKMSFKSKAINMMSTASLGVFLIHTQYMVSSYVWGMCGIQDACQSSLVMLGIHVMTCCLITYIVCSFIDLVCRKMVAPIRRVLDKISLLSEEIGL